MLLYTTTSVILLTTSPKLVFLCAKKRATSYLHVTIEYEKFSVAAKFKGKKEDENL